MEAEIKEKTNAKFSLKTEEPEIRTDNLWGDDKLERKKCADALTNLVAGQPGPLVISLNGAWGTGKTFFLKRWQAQLEKNGFKSIYFNAWEDDFIGNPLVSIIGQLWDSLKGEKFAKIVRSIKENAKPVLAKLLLNAVRVSTYGIVDLDAEDLKNRAEAILSSYSETRNELQMLRSSLQELADKVKEETGHPIIFIIDELDRCRPLFAIELLERVKHIFDVPNLIFVLGIDRDELSNAVTSVYGNIDVEGYLRRFFDMEFVLPPVKSKVFCKYLMEEHGLPEYFQRIAEKFQKQKPVRDYKVFLSLFSALSDGFGLSLRDMQYAIRFFVFSLLNLDEGYFIYPELLVVLILLKIKNKSLYQKFIGGKIHPAKVLDFIDEHLADDVLTDLDRRLLELNLYVTDETDRRNGHNIALLQLEQLIQGEKDLTKLDHLSRRIKKMNKKELEEFAKIFGKISGFSHFPTNEYPTRDVLEVLTKRIELDAMMFRESR